MPSKMSLFNKELILQIGRSTGWVSIVYLLGLLLALPIRILMMYSDENNRISMKVDHFFRYGFEIQIVLLVAIPILMTVFLFRFLHVKQATDLMHSLPLKRERIFHHYAFCGLGFLILPVVITAIIVLSIHSVLDLSPYFDIKEVFYWAGITILVDLLLYSAGIFVAMMTGISAVHAVLTYIFLLFPAGITLMVLYNLRIFLYGFPADYYLNSNLENMSPLTRAAVLDSKTFDWIEIFSYATFAIILYGLALFFYKKRKLEAASEPIAFLRLRAIFKYGATFCTMMVGGMYFNTVPYTSFGWTIFGYVAGSIIGYFVAEMVLQKTWRVFTRLKGLVVYSVIIVILVIATQMLGVYENKIPDQAEIKSVLLTNNLYSDQNKFIDKYYIPAPMVEKKNITAVRKLHQQILADERMNQSQGMSQIENTYIKYKLKNGDKVIREYRLNQKLYDDFFKPIYESTEYKRNSLPIFKVDERKIETINIYSNGPSGKRVIISEPEDVKQAMELLKKDTLAETYEDKVYYQDKGSNIEINMGKNPAVNLSLSPSYANFTKWLKEKGWLEQTGWSENDIDYVIVAKNHIGNRLNTSTENIEKDPEALKITDKEQIGQAIHNSGSQPGNYIAVFYGANNYQEIYFFDDEHAPDFIKNHFK